jgi:hypothetical protein
MSLPAPTMRRGVHRWRPLPGMPLHLDGSSHAWFGDGRPYDLLVMLDDATSEIYYAQVVEQESTRTVLAGLREVVEDRLSGTYCLSTLSLDYRQKGRVVFSFRPWFKCLLAAEVPDVSDLVQFPRAPRLLE